MSISSNCAVRHSAALPALALAWCALASSDTFAVELPGSLAEHPTWRQSGQGEARWWGFKLYDAALWIDGRRWSWQRPFALALRYSRSFSRGELVDASLKEIERLFEPERDSLVRWRGELEQAFDDVGEGDRLTGIFSPGVGVTFYRNDDQIRRIDDERLARHFFSIWLDPRTRSPGLRARLLGLSGDD